MEKSDDVVEREGVKETVENEIEDEAVIYYGEIQCQGSRGSGVPCANKAYYAQKAVGGVGKKMGLESFVQRRGTNRLKRKAQDEEKEKQGEGDTDEGEEEEEEEGQYRSIANKKNKRHKTIKNAQKGKHDPAPGAKGEGEGEEEERWLYLCGVHSRDKLGRRDLPKRDPKDRKRLERERIEADKAMVEVYRQRNQAAGRRGDIVLDRLRMLKAPGHREGYLRVYPNFKHQNKADGFGCMRLSPMSLGPVEHGQPGLPPALNIENFHQGTKVFTEELGRDGNPGKLYVKNRLRFYKDPVPHRHKYRGAKGANGGNRNVPVYFLWVDREGTEHRLDYIQSRQFYCNFYERLASKEADFAHLLELVEQGTNLQICGYDAQPLAPGESVEDAYLDPSPPFGHERVLYAMLLHHDQPEEYPWRKHKTFDF